MSIRPLAEADIPQVANLYWNYLRFRRGQAPTRMHSVFRELCIESPFVKQSVRPVVFEAPGGRIVGFSGGMARVMSACGQRIRVTFGGSLVVHPEFRSGKVAPQVVEAFFGQESDLALVDTANDTARKLLFRKGFSLIPALNLHWRRPILPTRYGVYGLSRLAGRWIGAGINIAARPFCWGADILAERVVGNSSCAHRSRLLGMELDAETLLHCLQEFRKGFSLWAEYELTSLQWLLGFMERRAARGNLRKVLLRDDKGQIVGWYLYHVKRGGVGEVVQLGGDPKSTKDILDHLFCDARQQGVVGLHGLLEMRRMTDFSDKNCFFTCRGGWTMARSAHSDLLRILETDSYLSRLDGEWCLDPGE